MKTILKGFLLILTISILSCTNEPCTSDLLGIYDGKCSSDIGEFKGKITISQSSKGDFDVLIEDEVLNDGDELVRGKVSSDCGIIEVPLQNLTDDNNNGYSVSGFFEIDGNKLTGEITFVFSGFGNKCIYDMTKL